MISHQLKVLIVEDSESDVKLALRLLKKGGYEVVYDVVDTAKKMNEALSRESWDLVISDYTLPQFSGLAALKTLHSFGIDVPFIIISGTIGEETAVEMMKAGAHDFVINNNMTRLLPVIKRELEHAEQRRTQRMAEIAIHNSEEKYRADFTLLNSILESPQDIIIFSLDKNFCYTSFTKFHKETMKQIWGVEIKIGVNMLSCITSPEDKAKAKVNFQRALDGEAFTLEEEYGDEKLLRTYYEDRYSPIYDHQDNIIGLSVFVMDITERKRTEKMLKENEEKFRNIFESVPSGMFFYRLENDNDLILIDSNLQASAILGIDVKRLVGNKLEEAFPNLMETNTPDLFKKIARKEIGTQTFEIEYSEEHFGGSYEVKAFYTGNNTIAVDFTDITEKKKNERDAQRYSALLKTAMESTNAGILIATAPDVKITYANSEALRIGSGDAAKLTNIPMEEHVSRWHIFYPNGKPYEPKDLPLSRAVLLGESCQDVEMLLITEQGEEKWILANAAPVRDASGNVVAGIVVFPDITERKKSEALLRKQHEELQSIFNISGAVGQAESLEVIYSEAINGIIEALKCDRASILIFDEDDKMHFKMWRGLSDDYRAKTDGHSPWTREDKSPQPLLVEDISASKNFGELKKIILKEGIASLGFIPLIYKNELLGKFMVYYNQPHQFSEDEVQLSKTIATQLAVAIVRKRDEDSLRKNEQYVRSILEHISNVFYMHTSEHLITYISPQIYKLLGYTQEEAKIKWTELVTENPINQLGYEATVKAIETGKAQPPYELELRHKNGSRVWVRVNETPIISDGETIQIVGALDDITDEKRSEIVQRIQFNIAHAIVKAQNLEELFESVRFELNSLFDTSNFFVAIYNEKKNMLTAPFDRDEKDNIEEWSADNSLTGYVIKNKKPFLFSPADIQKIESENQVSAIGTMPTQWMGVPLIIKNKPLGAIVIQSYTDDNAYTMADVEVVEQIAYQASLYMDHKHNEANVQKLTRAIEQSPVSVVMTDKDGNIEYVNQTFTKITGYALRDVLGQNPRVWKTDYHSKEYYAEMWEAILKGKDWEGEFLNKKKNGELYWENIIVSPLYGNEGEIINFVAVKEDITSRKKAEEEIRFQAFLLKAVGQAIIATDTSGNISYWNHAAEKIYGWMNNEVVGKNLFDIIPSNRSQNTIEEILRRLSTGENYEGEIIVKRKDGAEFPAFVTDAPLMDPTGGFIGMVGVSSDITKQKNLEDDLVKAKNKAEEMNQLKSSFLANMSHELRTPMIAILGYTEILSELVENDEAKRMIETIHDSGERLKDTLNMILDLSRIEAEKLDLHIVEINLNEVVGKAMNLFKRQAAKKNIALDFEESVKQFKVYLDSGCITIILNNLISNAIKFTSIGGVTVSLNKKKIKKKEYAEIKVIDTGIGISEKDQAVIWEEFRQASEGYGREYEGTGLGLTITKKFVKSLNGKIELQSERGKGSTFTVTLPVNFGETKNGDKK